MSDKDVQFPINQDLLTEASKIKQERKLVRERIQKVEAKKSEVSPSVYQKVKHDYTEKLNEITNALLEKKTDIDQELASLYETRSKLTENLDHHKEALEEMKFRLQIGEYDEAKFKELSAEEAGKISKFDKILAAVNANIERYEAIFADEEDIADAGRRGPAKPEKEKESEGTDYELSPEEEGYFAPEVADAPTSKSISEITSKSPAGEAYLIVIEGEGVGKKYKMAKEVAIGRASANLISLKDAKVSRQHAIIKQTGNEFVVMDLNSSNGVLVNHERVKEYVLGDGDIVQIGDSVFQFKIM